MKNNCVYFVEGQCEQKLLNALKESPQKIQPGRVKVFNLIHELIPKSHLITIQAGSTVVLVFDTDVPSTKILKENIRSLSKYCQRIKIIYLPQVLNLEDELVRCSDLKSVTELTHSRSVKDFKRDFCAMTNARAVLDRVNLDVGQLWTKEPPSEFSFLENNAKEIKI